MNSGRRMVTPSNKITNGTYRPSRDGHKIEMKSEKPNPENTIPMPDWLTKEGKEIWLDNINNCVPSLTEGDANCFGMYCNLMGLIAQRYKSGKVPPAAYLIETRKLAELLGMCGATSRVVDSRAAPGAGGPFRENRGGWR